MSTAKYDFRVSLMNCVSASKTIIGFGIHALYYLFASEHNYICDELKKEYSSMTDDELYDCATLILTASIVKIHTIEWTIALFGGPMHRYSQNVLYYGLGGSKKWSDFFGRFTKSDILVGVPKGKSSDRPFQHSEEFVSVYRFHPLLPSTYQVGETKYDINEISEWQRICYKENKMDDVFSYLGYGQPGQLRLQNTPSIQIDGAEKDLGFIDIFRDRTLNVLRYNDFRRKIGLRPVRSFDQLDKPELLQRVYGSVDEIDLQIGLIAERKMRQCVVGETTYAVFTVQTQRRMSHDPFLQDCFTEKYYTKLGMKMTDDITMNEIIKRHFPNMTPSHNPFLNWTTEGSNHNREA